MVRIIVLLLLVGLAWKSYTHYEGKRQAIPTSEISGNPLLSEPRARNVDVGQSTSKFRCDGRTHCSQMTSCEEATFFLRNCPGVKMDGNGDGVPCERQWCR